MLEMIFAAALMDTVIAPADYGTVYVHEWGAVTFTEEEVIFGTAPLADLYTDFSDEWDEPVARAPIVYFYGAQFSGKFTVTVPSGTFIETLPDPESLLTRGLLTPRESSEAVWMITETSPGHRADLVDEYPCISSDILAMWREPESYLLEFHDGAREKFIYYECAFQPSTQDDFYPVQLQTDGAALNPEYDGSVMRFVKDNGTVSMELITEWPSSSGELHTQGQMPDVPEILCDWAGGTMKSQELISMWNTWEGWIFDGSWNGDSLLVFPLPRNTVEGMTAIVLETDEYHDIEYSRFYLGFISN